MADPLQILVSKQEIEHDPFVPGDGEDAGAPASSPWKPWLQPGERQGTASRRAVEILRINPALAAEGVACLLPHTDPSLRGHNSQGHQLFDGRVLPWQPRM